MSLKRGFLAIAAVAALGLSACATSGDIERLDAKIDDVGKRAAAAEQRAAAAEAAAQRAAEEARAAAASAAESARKSDAIFQKSLSKSGR